MGRHTGSDDPVQIHRHMPEQGGGVEHTRSEGHVHEQDNQAKSSTRQEAEADWHVHVCAESQHERDDDVSEISRRSTSDNSSDACSDDDDSSSRGDDDCKSCCDGDDEPYGDWSIRHGDRGTHGGSGRGANGGGDDGERCHVGGDGTRGD